MPSKAKIESRIKAVKAQMDVNHSIAISKMAEAILSTSRMKAPKKDNHLRSSASIRASGQFKRDIVYGQGLERYGKGYNYAAYQEYKEKTAHSRYTTPGTGPHFLEQAGEAIVKKGIGAYLK